ncbi:MAG: ABC transporter permease subunit [Bdellovibrionota bacterium]
MSEFAVNFSEIWQIFLQTFWQASSSSLLSLGVGFFIALGLINLKSNKTLSFFEWFFISPQILPSLFILLSVYQIYAAFESAPAGFLDIVIIHVLINAGFSGVQISRVLKTKIGGFAELAQVEGANAVLFFKTVIPYLFKDFMQIFFTVFVFCFLSFSIPVVVGGKASETLEVLIYKKILSDGHMNSALIISLIQFVLIALLGWVLNSSAKGISRLQNYRTINYGSRWLLALPVLVISILYFYTFKDIGDGFLEVFKQKTILVSLAEATLGTFITSVLAGSSVLLFTLILSYFWPRPVLSRLLFVITPPSLVFVGLLIFLLGWSPSTGFVAFAVLGIALAFLFFSALYRFGIASLLDGVTHQIQVARSLGASRFLIFRRIVLPQLSQHFSYFAGIAAFWAAGDFALSLFIVPVESNLALFVKTLISRYRLEMATAVMWWMMAIGLLVFLFFKGVGRVVHRKLN